MSDSGNNREPVNYYSRERRLSRASPVVQALNTEKARQPGLFNSLFGNKANLMLFVTILIICVGFGLGSRYAGKNQGLKIGGNTVALVIHPEQGSLVLGIIKNAPKSGEAYIGEVDIAAYPALPESQKGKAPPVITYRIVFNPVDSETYRLSLPLEGTDFFVVLKAGEEQKSIKINIKTR